MRYFQQVSANTAGRSCSTFTTRPTSATVAIAVCLALGACNDQQSSSADADNDNDNDKAPQIDDEITRDRSVLVSDDASGTAQFSLVDQASAVLLPTENASVSGEVFFKPDAANEQMLVLARLRGLTPGEHGLHIHAVGDCSASDASSAGGHFNPYNVQHGGPNDPRHHLGDLGNVTADAEGNVDTTLTAKRLGFSGPTSVLQKAVVVHASADDLESDPAGNAGKRLACGVITIDREVLSDSMRVE